MKEKKGERHSSMEESKGHVLELECEESILTY